MVRKTAGRDRCTFPFFRFGVPDVGFYDIGVGNRGSLVYSKDDLSRDGWHVTLSLGSVTIVGASMLDQATATYNMETPVGRVRLTLGDTDVANAAFSDAEIELFLSRYVNLAQSRREDWAAAEAIETLLMNDGRLVGKSTVLGVSLDSTAWRGAARDRIKLLRQRHIMGPG